MPEAARERIRRLLGVLDAQPFFPARRERRARRRQRCLRYLFDSCAEALAAYRERLPKLLELAKALAIAELEIEGGTTPSGTTRCSRRTARTAWTARSWPRSPTTWSASTRSADAAEQTPLMEILFVGLPIKVLIQVDDLLDARRQRRRRHSASGCAAGRSPHGHGPERRLRAAVRRSNLFRFRERIADGHALRRAGPVQRLFRRQRRSRGLPPYLMAAAAMESRAFPAFTYDPSAGPDWASRFYLEANPQVDRDWPVRVRLRGRAAPECQRGPGVHAGRFPRQRRALRRSPGRVPREKWNGS